VKTAAITALLLAASAATASAETEASTVVSVPILGVSSNAIAVQAEHPVARHLSVSLGVGGSDAADGDYQAFMGALGAELRVWLRTSQRGLFGAPRLETSMTHIRQTRDDRSLGNAWTIAEGLVAGYRFVIADHIEITPVAGMMLFHDLGPRRLPAQTRVAFTASLALGWVF
jgi:hypothetical protein